MANALPSTISRLINITKWLTADQIGTLDSESEIYTECASLAARLGQELAVWRQLASNTVQQVPLAKLRAILAVLASCSHQTAARDDVARVLAAAAEWIAEALVQPPNDPPSSTQLSVARALLRARVLHGCSRQLGGMADRIAGASGQPLQPLSPGSTSAQEQAAQPPQLDFGPWVEGVALCTTAHTVTYLLSTLALLSTRCPPFKAEGAEDEFVDVFCAFDVGSSEGTEGEGHQDGGSSAGEAGPGTSTEAAGSAGSGEEAGMSGEERERASEQQQQQGAAGAEHLAAGPVHAEAGAEQGEPHPSSWVLELVSCLSSSAVLEHAARGVLLAGTKVKQQHLQQQQQPQQCQQSTEALRAYAGSLQQCAISVVGTYCRLSSLTCSRHFLEGEGPDGAQPPAAFDDSLAPGDRAPLRAQPHAFDMLSTYLLRRALSGPCVRHLMLCMGLKALCALDGGPTYGVPEGAGMQWLPLAVTTWPSGAQSLPLQQQPNFVLLSDLALLNLLMLLAMSPCDPDADAEPPNRGTRLRLTLRVAWAAVLAARKVEVPIPAGCGDNIVRYAMTPRDAGQVAVEALHFAWRHMPPPEGRGGSRRRAALREWAALVGEVARSALVPSMEDKTAYRLGLLLGAHPDLLRPSTANGAFRMRSALSLDLLAPGASVILPPSKHRPCTVRYCNTTGQLSGAYVPSILGSSQAPTVFCSLRPSARSRARHGPEALCYSSVPLSYNATPPLARRGLHCT